MQAFPKHDLRAGPVAMYHRIMGYLQVILNTGSNVLREMTSRA
jgi:hypothetical protein